MRSSYLARAFFFWISLGSLGCNLVLGIDEGIVQDDDAVVTGECDVDRPCATGQHCRAGACVPADMAGSGGMGAGGMAGSAGIGGMAGSAGMGGAGVNLLDGGLPSDAGPGTCDEGATGEQCLPCIANEYRCVGDVLQHCRGDLSGFDEDDVTMCEPGECNADMRMCTSMVCVANEHLCDNDNNILRRCNGDGSGFVDAAEENCSDRNRVCSTSARACVICRNDTDCEARNDGTRVCLNPGGSGNRCVQCATAADCPTAGACRTATCSAQGVCGEQISTSGSCGPGRVCNFRGECEVACGNGRYDVGHEACDATSTAFTRYTCDNQCRARTLYTPCDSSGGCIAPNECDRSGFGAYYCSPVCTDEDVSACMEGVSQGSTVVCFGGTCLIECDYDAHCPQPMVCPDVESYCEAP